MGRACVITDYVIGNQKRKEGSLLFGSCLSAFVERKHPVLCFSQIIIVYSIHLVDVLLVICGCHQIEEKRAISLIHPASMEGQPDSTASLASSIAATLTTFAATAAATATLSLNSTTDSSPFLQGGLVDETPAIINDGNPVVNFILGFLIVIGASIMNAFGLNLTKLDHVSERQHRDACMLEAFIYFRSD